MNILQKVIKTIPPVTRKCNPPLTLKRHFLSEAYYCKDVWNHRLNDPFLKSVNHDEFYHELDQRFIKSKVISAVDVDIFSNSCTSNLFFDELLDIAYKLRLSSQTTSTLESTPHAITRYLLEQNKLKELLNILDDRLNYGIFVDYYTANILMDTFYKLKDFTSGARVASQLMLQEEVDHPLSASLALINCYNFILTPSEWPFPPKPEEPEEDVKVRVKYLRNPYNDEHFDLEDPSKIVGKTLLAFTKFPKDILTRSFHILGLVLYGKKDKLQLYLTSNSDLTVYKEIIDLISDTNELKVKVASLKTESGNIQDLLEKSVIDSERKIAEKDIALQCKRYLRWEELRKEALEQQNDMLQTQRRIQNIELTLKELKAKEEKLWFFENEEQMELEIEDNTPKVNEEELKDKSSTKQEENYVPPEIIRKRS